MHIRMMYLAHISHITNLNILIFAPYCCFTKILHPKTKITVILDRRIVKVGDPNKRSFGTGNQYNCGHIGYPMLSLLLAKTQARELPILRERKGRQRIHQLQEMLRKIQKIYIASVPYPE